MDASDSSEQSLQGPDAKSTTTVHAPANLLSQESAYTKRHRKLLDQLIAIGIQQLIDVPKIAVVGSQSAGKSSILEALSGITFPRASGTCTRCPSEVRLFSSTTEEWVCKVSLRFEIDSKGKRLDEVRSIPFGEPLTDPSKVRKRLELAQRAILNPSKSPTLFLRQEEPDYEQSADGLDNGKNEFSFSRNVVCIEVKGKDLRDLSVVDLPGLIANVGHDENKNNINLITNLAKDVIAKENCIILCCISMNEDFQTQPSVTLAREADSTGKRTLGVLTKPDRIEEGNFILWKPVLEGHEQKLLHNYYVVKNPKPEELGKMTWKQARASEKRFFKQERWVSMGSSLTSRMGADNLATKLSSLLEQIIKEQMPIIVKKVKLMHSQVSEELATLPEQVPEGRLLFHLSSLVRDFDKDFKYELLETQEADSLANDLYTISLDFWADMINHRPRFLPMTTSELEGLKEQKKVTGLKMVRVMRDFIFEEDKAELKARGIVGHKEFNLKDDESLVPFLMDLKRCTTLYGSSTLVEADLNDSAVLFTLTEISDIKARATRDLLPNNTPWSVKRQLIEVCIKSWPGVALLALRDIETRVLEECKDLIKKHFSRFRIGGLELKIIAIMEKVIADRVEKTKSFLLDLAKLESRYTTISTHDFLGRQAKLKRDFTAARDQCRSITLAELNGREVEHKSPVFQDNVDDELSLISEILVYWQIAFKRYTDNVRSAFYTILLEPIAEDCQDIITAELGIFDDDASSKVKGWLQEDQDTVQRRKDLLAKQATLNQSRKVINAFTSGSLKVDE